MMIIIIITSVNNFFRLNILLKHFSIRWETEGIKKKSLIWNIIFCNIIAFTVTFDQCNCNGLYTFISYMRYILHDIEPV